MTGNMNELEKRQGTEIILDLDSGKMVEVTPQQRRMATMLHDQIMLGAYISAISLKRMFDEKLYLAMGCQSQEEYLSTVCPYSRGQAYKLVKIADKFENTFKALTGNGLNAPLLSESLESIPNDTFNGDTVVKPEDIQRLGMRKLYELAQVEDDDLMQLIREGKIEGEGGTVTFEELKNATAKQMAIQIKAATEKYKEETKRLRGRTSLLEEDNKKLAKENESLMAKLEHAREIETKYGGSASKLEDKRNTLDSAAHLLMDFQEVMSRAGVTAEDPLTLKKTLIDIIRDIDEVHQVVQSLYGEVILSME